jgi:hypothetical protein
LPEDYYKTLGVTPVATAEEIKKAWRKQVLIWHPDRNDDPLAVEQFRRITVAYEVLSDPVKRRDYDRNAIAYSHRPDQFQNHYLEMRLNKSIVKVCEEFELSLVYSGEGRYLRKPDMGNFYITGRPYVTFSEVNRSGFLVRETCIRYVLSARKPGNYFIRQASIKVNGKEILSNSLQVEAINNQCYFSGDPVADGIPCKLSLWYDADRYGSHRRFTINTRHTVFIPRSHRAEVYHGIGRGLKIIFTLWGLILAIIIHRNILLGIACGSAYGALMAYVMYAIARIKPYFYYSMQYRVVREYLEQDYHPYPPSDRLPGSRWIYFFRRLWI